MEVHPTKIWTIQTLSYSSHSVLRYFGLRSPSIGDSQPSSTIKVNVVLYVVSDCAIKSIESICKRTHSGAK